MNRILSVIEKYKNKGSKFQIRKLEEDIELIKEDLPGISSNAQEDLFLFKESLLIPPHCPVCSKPKLFINYKKGYQNTCHSNECIRKYSQIKREESFLKKYGIKNPKQIKEVNDKIEETNLKKYGHKNAATSLEIKQKIKETFIKNYGVDNPLKANTVKEKIKSTNLERYGVENTYQLKKVKDKIKERYGDNFGFGSDFFKEKSKETCNEKWGVNYHLQRPEIHKVISETMNELYGGRGLGSLEISERIYDEVERIYGERHPMHNEEIKKRLEETYLSKYGETHYMKVADLFDKHCKKSFKIKRIILPSGKIVNVQGYEPFAIKWFLENDYVEEDLIISNKEIENNIGKIKYLNPIKNNESRYYPDIFIKKDNLVIEVKSEYTYRQNKEVNELKRNAVLKNGLNFKFMIFTSIKENDLKFYFL
jgi:hypothetical protein